MYLWVDGEQRLLYEAFHCITTAKSDEPQGWYCFPAGAGLPPNMEGRLLRAWRCAAFV